MEDVIKPYRCLLLVLAINNIRFLERRKTYRSKMLVKAVILFLIW